MDCVVQPLMIGLLAEGNIRIYEIALVVLNAGNVILSYFALKHGFVPESVYVVSIIVEIGIMWSRIWLSGKAYELPIKKYCIEVISKVAIIAVITGIFTYWFSLPIENLFGRFITVSIIVVLFTAVVIYIIGLRDSEKSFIFKQIKNRLSISGYINLK